MPAPSPIYVGSSSSHDAPPDSDSPKDELARVNEAIYRQNVELAVRNKTLNVLRTLYAVATSALHVREACQQIADTIVKELGFTIVLIHLVDKKERVLNNAAITKSESIRKALEMIGKPIEETGVPLTDRNNLMARAIRDHERKITGNFFDILTPLVTQEVADEMKRITTIKTAIIYPLFFGEKALGALTIGLSKNVDDLSRAEKETLDQLISVVAITIDRTQLLEDIQNANEKLKLLDKLKDEFISIASHELRSPLTSVKNYLWLTLEEKTLPAGLAHDLSRAYSGIERAVFLVGDMLDVSRIEAGRIDIHPATVDVSAIVTSVAGDLTEKAAEKDIALTLHVPPSITLTSDAERLEQILTNLVDNAIKYTPAKGTVTVTLGLDSQQKTATISVADTGIGIQSEDLPKLFTKFGRLQTSLTTMPQVPGTGLGLYITKRLVELLGGTIAVTSTFDRGSTFTVTLPVG